MNQNQSKHQWQYKIHCEQVKKKSPIQPNTKNEMNTEKKPSSSPSSKSVKAKPNYFSSINIQIVVIYALLSVGIYMVYLYI